MGHISDFPDNAARIGADHEPLPQLPPIPRRRYTDESIYRLEIDHVWRKTWLMVGHISEFEKEGSYRLLDIPFAPVLLVRGADGEPRALLNSCPHRGATVLHEGAGRVRALSCQYHGWTFDFDGKLVGISDRESFPGLKLDDYRLDRLRCERFGGFIYINFDDKAPPLKDWLASIDRRHAELANAPLRIVARQAFELNCNWKIAIEAFRETYHIAFIHRQTAAQGLIGPKTSFEMYPNGHGAMYIPFRANLSQVEWEGMVAKSQLPVLPGTKGPEFMQGVVQISVFPNAAYGFQPQGFPVFMAWPLGVDRCRLELIYFAGDWGDLDRPVELDAVIGAMEVLAAEDMSCLRSIQESVEAKPNDKGFPLSTQECLIYQLHVEIDRLIGKENIPPELRVPDVLAEFVGP